MAKKQGGFRAKLTAISDLTLYENNPRNNDPAVDAVAKSIEDFGFRVPVIVDKDGVVIAGHTRIKAAEKLGLERVPVHVADDLTKAQARALRIADNKTAELAEWDMDLLAQELTAIIDGGGDVEALGFTDAEIDSIVGGYGTEGQTDPDAVPEPPKKPVSKQGELYQLGEHRLMCGDSTSGEDVARLMDGEKADLCFTSPPYGQQREYTKEGKEKCKDWEGLMRGVFGNLQMADAGQLLVNLGMIHRDGEWLPYWDGWIAWMQEQGWRRFGWYVWDQGFGLPGDWNGRFSPSHEFVFHFNRISVEPQKFLEKKHENIKARNPGASTMRGKDGKCKAFTNPGASAQPNKIPDSVIRINRMHGGHGINHPAIFPVELPAFIMHSWPGVAYDPFLGSGTTLIACEQLNRKCYGMEISPAYCDVIRKRWAEYVHGEGCNWKKLTPKVKA